jgi:hypothetical protein
MRRAGGKTECRPGLAVLPVFHLIEIGAIALGLHLVAMDEAQ